ncbi:ATP-dependent RNA helicase chl1 [Zostera marina]|uniref:ATP-dependent RNA helicase chl1 n=1 Tax=Zostera marina TaxID=29655 RepID=A0A0K9Q189_ZOSMR|nr:ATP-dependent RNA helicase chl1 [Zostera marina]
MVGADSSPRVAGEGKWRRRDFPAFPFEPYSIQIEFMMALYDSLESGGVALLESPTGTGKTLSIICSALQWLLDQREKPKKASTRSTGDEEEPDWMRDFVMDVPEKKYVVKKRDGFRFGGMSNCKRDLMDRDGKIRGEGEDDEFLMEEYDSDIDERLKRKSESLSSSDDEDEGGEEQAVEVVPKIYFCSRTHSQLSQFIKEFKRTSFVNEISLVCLGSRKNLCINPEVLNLKNVNRINERCIDLQNNKNIKDSRTKIKDNHGRKRRTKSLCGCPMLKKNSEAKKLRDELFQNAMDIEDLVRLGNNLGTCPYYGTRSMVPVAQLVVLPYQSLLMKSARESLSLNLKESVLIIDEAHNLADSITSMYNSKITLSQLKQVLYHLEHYLNRFKTCLGPGNRRYIQTLMVLVNSFKRILLSEKDDTSHVIVSMTINEFLFSLDIDNINLVKLQHYIKQSKIIYKVTGYGNKLQSLEIEDSLRIGRQNQNLQGSAISGFQALVDILFSLSNNDPDGRMIVSKQQ